MGDHVNIPRENKISSAVNQVLQARIKNSSYYLVDNRPKTALQRKLQELTNKSSFVQNMEALQEVNNNKPELIGMKASQQMDNKHFSETNPIQRKLEFTHDADFLDSKKNNEITYAAYIALQNKAENLKQTIQVTTDDTISSQALFQRLEGDVQGNIKVKPLPSESSKDFEYEKSERLIQVAHEIQHALDHFKVGSLIKKNNYEVNDELGVETELNAFAAQSAQTDQLIEANKKVSVKLREMRDAFINSTNEKPTDNLLTLMKRYAYEYSTNFKNNNAWYDVENKESFVNQVKEFIKLYYPSAKAIYEELMHSQSEPTGAITTNHSSSETVDRVASESTEEHKI